jgi:hypothetical protein
MGPAVLYSRKRCLLQKDSMSTVGPLTSLHMIGLALWLCCLFIFRSASFHLSTTGGEPLQRCVLVFMAMGGIEGWPITTAVSATGRHGHCIYMPSPRCEGFSCFEFIESPRVIAGPASRSTYKTLSLVRGAPVLAKGSIESCFSPGHPGSLPIFTASSEAAGGRGAQSGRSGMECTPRCGYQTLVIASHVSYG